MALRTYSEREILAYRSHLKGVPGPVPNVGTDGEGRNLSKDEVHSRRATLKKALRALLDKAEEGKRELTDEEHIAFRAGMDYLDNLNNMIGAMSDIADQQAAAGERQADAHVERWSTKDGNLVHVVAPEGRVASFVRENRQDLEATPSFGRFVRSMVLGPRTETERRALAESTDSTGGYTVPAAVSAELIDRMRARATIIRAGARTVPLTTDKTTIARLATDPTGSWRAENALVGESDPTFQGVTFNTRTLAALVRVSRELLEDSINIEEALMNAFAQAMSLELDRVGLFGSGSGEEPTGVFSTAGIGAVGMGTNGAQITNFSEILDAIQTLQDANAEAPTAAILAPRTWRTISGFVDTTGQPLRMPQAIESLPFMATTQVPVNQTQGTATNASSIIIGNFQDLMIGVRTSLRVEVLRERYAEYLQYGFLAYLRADIQVARPGSFCVVNGIIP